MTDKTIQERAKASAESKEGFVLEPVELAPYRIGYETGYKSALESEEVKAMREAVSNALDLLGHNENDYACGEGNIKDACIELSNCLTQFKLPKR